jgi:hypothetical protein
MLSVGDAFAAGGASDGEVLRLDFANSPAFQSAFEKHFSEPGASDSAATSAVPPKMRVALWTSQSVPQYRAEVLREVPPPVILAESSPREQITAKTARSVWLEEPTSARLAKTRKRHVRRESSAPIIVEEEEPSLLQSIFGSLFAGG